MNNTDQHDTAAIMDKIQSQVKEHLDSALASLSLSCDLGEIEQQTEALCRSISGEIIGHLVGRYLSSPSTLTALKKYGGTRCLRFKEMRSHTLKLGCGATINLQTPYFVSAKKRSGKKKAGPNGSGACLGLEVLGCIGKHSPKFVSRVAQSAVLAPSFETANTLLKEWGISTSLNSIRRICYNLGQQGMAHRGRISLNGSEEIKGYSLVIGIDGGRIRERRRKRGRKPKHLKRQGFHTDWKEPKLLTMYLIDENGNAVKEFKPVHDATMENHDGLFEVLTQYLEAMNIEELERVVFTADGAPWIWQGIEKRLDEWFTQRGLPADRVYQVLDYTHAKQHLNELLDLVPAASQKKAAVDWKKWLWEGKSDALKQGIKTLVTRGKKRKKALSHWESYFETNAKRMNYSVFKAQGLVCGSGCVESAIRRVINLRLKAPGSFWLKEMAETFLFLRSQFISGRWNVFMGNVTHHKTKEFLCVQG